jgi:CubicO group peptidase (beta-lactamase class C family)
MRSGYPWEELEGYFDELSTNKWLHLILEFPLTHDPGTQFGYSNLTAHVMGIIIARAANMTLMDFADTYLCDPLNIDLTQWSYDASGYYYGSGDMHFRSRDLAKFGNLYLNKGLNNNVQIIPEEWINESFQKYSTNLYGNRLGLYFYNIGYGYLWWSATAGNYSFNFAWGHGGQLIIIIQEMNMVIVVTADPLDHELGDTDWVKTRKIIDLVAKYIASIP